MGKGGLSKRLLDLIGIVFGRFTGGLGIVSIVTCLFFAAISGTGSATVAAVGCIMLPSMFEKKYDKVFSSSLIATAGTTGVIIPPRDVYKRQVVCHILLEKTIYFFVKS